MRSTLKQGPRTRAVKRMHEKRAAERRRAAMTSFAQAVAQADASVQAYCRFLGDLPDRPDEKGL